MKRWLLTLAMLLAALPAAAELPRVAVAAVGGLSLCGTWPRLAEKIGKTLGLEIVTVSSGPKDVVVPAFSRGEADVLLLHGSDASFALLADGRTAPLRAVLKQAAGGPWIYPLPAAATPDAPLKENP